MKTNKTMALYDRIGINYSDLRKPDHRIEKSIWKEIGEAVRILNIGAGAGSYEPKDPQVTAVEPSATMIAQRPRDAAPVIQASAEELPFGDKEFDLAMAFLTVHHWGNLEEGLFEMRRVSRRQLIFTWDPTHPGFWLTQDYFPEILAIDQAIFPPFGEIEKILGPLKRIPVSIPQDCTDGFGCAYWQRPEAYLLPEVRQAISTFAKIKETETGVRTLQTDLDSGDWEARYGHLRKYDSLDLGYTLLVN
ncbi:MAG: class I SAM-dependent methyltransferase [Cryomorphaceae bacterium]